MSDNLTKVLIACIALLTITLCVCCVCLVCSMTFLFSKDIALALTKQTDATFLPTATITTTAETIQPTYTQLPKTPTIETHLVPTEMKPPANTIAPTFTATLQPSNTPEIPTPTLDWKLMQTFTGDGKWTSDLFALPAGLVRIKWSFTGDGNFAFDINDMNSDFHENLENAIGKIDGQRVLKLDASDRYVIDVVFADGPWQITVEYMP